MHEYKLTLDIIEIAEKNAFAAAGRSADAKVSKITLVIGESSGVSGESIKMYFDQISKGSVCEGAEIEIESVAPMLRCKTCSRLFRRKPFLFACTYKNCGGEGEPTEIGREFYVKSIELRE